VTATTDHPGGAGTSPARVPDGPEPLAPGLGAVPECGVLPGQPGDDRDGREPLADRLDPVDRTLRRGEVPSVVQAPAPAPPRTHAETVTWCDGRPYEARCPVCNVVFRVRHGGWLAMHGPGGGRYGGKQRMCPGSKAVTP